jgi:hypothetical protein
MTRTRTVTASGGALEHQGSSGCSMPGSGHRGCVRAGAKARGPVTDEEGACQPQVFWLRRVDRFRPAHDACARQASRRGVTSRGNKQEMSRGRGAPHAG